jgi:hypothetical protein
VLLVVVVVNKTELPPSEKYVVFLVAVAVEAILTRENWIKGLLLNAS